MGKSKFKSFSRFNNRDWDDEEDDYGSNHVNNKHKRKEKKLRNLIRSKNVDRLMELDEDED
jgi:hypothetical protein